jgi:autotransporter-associated beta strand protein
MAVLWPPGLSQMCPGVNPFHGLFRRTSMAMPVSRASRGFTTLPRLIVAAAAAFAVESASPAADVSTLYTQTGTDATWPQLLASNAIPIGTVSTAGITGSVINVNNPLVEAGPNKSNPIISNLRLHTLGNSSVTRSSFSKWSRWYQEDGTTQVFRLFKDEVNVQNDRPNAARIESFNPDIDWAAGDGWFQWRGTYTIIKPLGAAIFQAKNSDNDWSVMINTNGNGDVTLNHRRDTDKVLATNMVGQPFDITVYDNGTNYAVYMDDQYAGYGAFDRPTGVSEFRWGMYVGGSIPNADAMLFVTGAKITPNIMAPPKLSGSFGALPATVIRGASVSGTLSVSNSIPVTSSTGATRLDYRYASSGLFAGSGTGSDMALGAATTHLIPVRTSAAGLLTGTVSATATTPLTATPTFSQTVSMSVLDPAIGSFSAGSTLTSLDIDFGTLAQGSGTASRGFSIFNRAGSLGAAWTAKLDLDGITTSSSSVFSTTLAAFTSLASGSSRAFSLSMPTSTAGVFSGTYSLNLSDENLPGATSRSMRLTVRGIVAPPSLSSAWTGTTGGSWTNGASWSAGVPNSAAAVATIGSASTSPAIITLDAPITVNVLSHTVATGTIAAGSGGSIVFGGTDATVVVASALTIAAPVSGGFLKSGTGTLFLTGSNTTSGTVMVASGAIDVTNVSFARPGRSYAVAAGTVLSLSGTTPISFSTTGTTTISGDGVVRVSPGTTLTNANVSGQGDLVVQLGREATLEVNGVMGAGWTAGRGVINWTNNQADLELGPAARFNAQMAPDVRVDAILGTGSITKTSTGGTVLTIGVAGGSGTFAGAISNSLGTISIVKTGTGTQTLAAATAFTGSTSVTQGTLQIAHPDALSATGVTVAAGATLAVAPQVQATVPSLINHGRIDVGLGMLTVASGQTPSGLVNQIMVGIVGGGTTGITSSDAAQTGGAFTVGWLDNGDGSMTFGYAATGDTNLDMSVDVLDVANVISSGKFNSGLDATWAEGDFTYDGLADILDIATVMSSGLFNADPYNASSPSVAAVPEPASCVVTIAGLLLLAAARRRSRGSTWAAAHSAARQTAAEAPPAGSGSRLSTAL